MATIAEIRAKYPQYADMPDAALADALHKKFYADMPQNEFNAKIGLTPSAPTAPQAPSQTGVPEWGRKNPTLYGIAGAARETLGPIIEGLGMAGGGLVGAPLGPAGAVGGAGLGYGIGKGITKMADIALGNEAPETASQAMVRGAKDVLEGSTMETGGRVAAPILTKGAQLVGKGIGKVLDVTQIPQQRAARLARNALGPDLEMVKNALAQQPTGVTAGQATADITSPTWQALIERALKRDPRFLETLKQSQGEVSLNALRNLVGGSTQTEARMAQEGAKNALNETLIPTLKTELSAANIAGEKLPVLQGEADRFAQAAAGKVEDVRRFTAAAPRAEAAARTNLIERGLPVGAAKYTYLGELGQKAEQVATQAAEASLPFGEASRFAQAAADSLAAHGLKPLESAPIVARISKMLGNPEFAGNKDISGALSRVAQDIGQWTNQGGVIDAFALDAIRKNSVNAAIRDLYPAADAKVQKELAASVLSKVKPLIVDAIEQAGGTGYGKYLSDYAAGRQAIAQQKLGAYAMDLFNSNKKAFIELVEGNAPRDVEKIFGPGSYDLAKEMSGQAMESLKGVAKAAARDIKVEGQAAAGQDALRALMEKSGGALRLPPWFNRAITTTNEALKILEGRIGTKTLDVLTEAAKSGKSMNALLETLPANERVKVIRVLSNPQNWGVPIQGVKGAAINALVPDERQNALAP